MFEIIDDNGTIHSGTEEEMMEAWIVMTDPFQATKKQIKKWTCEYSGDIKLVKILSISR